MVWADFDEAGDTEPTNSVQSSLSEEADNPPLLLWVNPILSEETVIASPEIALNPPLILLRT